MARYRAATKFGPWKRGDVFESTDPYHAVLAAQGHLVELEGRPDGPDGAWAGDVWPDDPADQLSLLGALYPPDESA